MSYNRKWAICLQVGDKIQGGAAKVLPNNAGKEIYAGMFQRFKNFLCLCWNYFCRRGWHLEFFRNLQHCSDISRSTRWIIACQSNSLSTIALCEGKSLRRPTSLTVMKEFVPAGENGLFQVADADVSSNRRRYYRWRRSLPMPASQLGITGRPSNQTDLPDFDA